MKNKQIEPGDVFPINSGGTVTVVEYRNSREVIIQHNDSYGYVATVQACKLRNGVIKNPYHKSVYGVGFIGFGNHSVGVGGKTNVAYKTWQGMLERCYCPKKHAEFPTYAGCSVHPDWHNFQNFAEWFEKQYLATCWQLDKDLIVEGNKVYSADTCTFVPQQLNTLLCDSGAARGVSPQGVSRSGKGYKASLSVDGNCHYLGTHAFPEEAFEVYKKAKEYNVKRMAEQYKYLIDPRVYESLMRYVATQSNWE